MTDDIFAILTDAQRCEGFLPKNYGSVWFPHSVALIPSSLHNSVAREAVEVAR